MFDDDRAIQAAYEETLTHVMTPDSQQKYNDFMSEVIARILRDGKVTLTTGKHEIDIDYTDR